MILRRLAKKQERIALAKCVTATKYSAVDWKVSPRRRESNLFMI